ncbi:MAG: sugar-binding domain-containing protein [Verrucomicrobiae bacterium]
MKMKHEAPKSTPVTSLDGEGWHIAADPNNQGREGKWFEAARPEAMTVAVPSTIQEAFPNYHGLAWYWRSFTVPVNPDPEGRTLLRFWSVDYKADVWVNGVLVGSHEDGEEPFLLDVTDAVRSGKANLLAIRVLNPTHERIDGIVLYETARGAKDLPHHPGLEWNFGGILDSVELLSVSAISIEDLHLLPDWRTGEIKVEATVFNAGSVAVSVRLGLEAAPGAGGETVARFAVETTVPAGRSLVNGSLIIPQHRLWELDAPFLYRVTARLQATGSQSTDERSTRCGFRHFDFEDGYFRLNGHRIFLRSAHSLWTTPVKIHSCQDLAPLRKDMLYAKTMGFNTVRFLPFAGARAHLDLCDELGLMVMQQSSSSWLMDNSPAMPERFDRSLFGIIRRDRNHPCVALWYLLNETHDGAVFRHAVEMLPKLRELDSTRLCLLSSGRWDRDLNVNSISRPGSNTWDVPLNDVHNYLPVPHGAAEISWLRGGAGAGNVDAADHSFLQAVDDHAPKGATLLSEYGVASAMDLVSLARYYERMGATDKMDALYYRANLDKFMADWRQWHLDEVFGRPEDYFKSCIAANAEHRRLGMNALRSNPKLVGYSMTALHDEVSCGEGPITFLRDLKPGAVDAIRTGFAPLKWNLFVEPWNIYRGGTVHAEVVLANEDVLPPGSYQVEVGIFGPNQEAVLREIVPLQIAETEEPFALPVWKKDVKLDGPAGRYRLTATFVSGAAAVDGEAAFQVSDPALMPEVNVEVALWGEDPELATWLKESGVACRPFAPGASSDREVIVTSGNRVVSRSLLEEFSRRVRQGATAVMLTPEVVQSNDSPSASMPTRWTVFEKFDNHTAPEPEDAQLTSIPETLQLGEQTGRRHVVEVGEDGGCQDLSPLWGGLDHKPIAMEISPVVYIYVPFEISRGGSHMMKFDADYWYKAWLDGKAVSDSVSQSNEVLVNLEEGAHLLVVKLVSGSGGCRLRLSSWETDALTRFHSPKLNRLDFVSGFYHRDDWARRHPIFDGLPTGLLDWATYRNIVPHDGKCLQDLGDPDEVVCGALQTCYAYKSGPYVAVYRHGAGQIVMNTLNIRENLGKDPVADRLLRNLLKYAAAKPYQPK